MKGLVEMKCSNLGVEMTCKLEGVSIADKAHLFHCLKQALEVNDFEWRLINDFLKFLERYEYGEEEEEEGAAPDIIGRAKAMGLNVEDKASGVFINGDQNKMRELLRELLEGNL